MICPIYDQVLKSKNVQFFQYLRLQELINWAKIVGRLLPRVVFEKATEK